MQRKMPEEPVRDVTQLLRAWGQGDRDALDRLTPMVYQELRRIARRHMQHERPGHTLQATALVNEAFLRLADAPNVPWQDRAHFFAIAAQLMRRVLVESARATARLKRGGNLLEVTWDDGLMVAPEREVPGTSARHWAQPTLRASFQVMSSTVSARTT